MQNCYELNLDFHPFVEGFEYPPPPTEKNQIHQYGIDSVSSEFKEWMKLSRLYLDSILVFAHPVRDSVVRYIHLDGEEGKYIRPFSINWNYGSKKIAMEWYECTGNTTESGGHRHYLNYKEENCRLLETSTCIGPVLFRNSIPHCVINLDTVPRYGISVRFKNPFTWEKVVAHLHPYIKLPVTD